MPDHSKDSTVRRDRLSAVKRSGGSGHARAVGESDARGHGVKSPRDGLRAGARRASAVQRAVREGDLRVLTAVQVATLAHLFFETSAHRLFDISCSERPKRAPRSSGSY